MADSPNSAVSSEQQSAALEKLVVDMQAAGYSVMTAKLRDGRPGLWIFPGKIDPDLLGPATERFGAVYKDPAQRESLIEHLHATGRVV